MDKDNKKTDDNLDAYRQFPQAYEALCLKFKMRLEPRPEFVPTNHGTFEVRVSMIVVKTA